MAGGYSTQKKFSDSLQFTFNKSPFNSIEKAKTALRAKNLLPGEPAVAYYRNDDGEIASLLAVGDIHNSNNPLILGADAANILDVQKDVSILKEYYISLNDIIGNTPIILNPCTGENVAEDVSTVEDYQKAGKNLKTLTEQVNYLIGTKSDLSESSLADLITNSSTLKTLIKAIANDGSIHVDGGDEPLANASTNSSTADSSSSSETEESGGESTDDPTDEPTTTISTDVLTLTCTADTSTMSSTVEVTYYSEDETVAIVDQMTGVVTAVDNGTTYICAEDGSGNIVKTLVSVSGFPINANVDGGGEEL